MTIQLFAIRNYLIIAITFFTLHSCTPEDVPQNPCANAHFTKADFLIEELVEERYFLGDTVNGMNMVRFTALQDADEYTWTLGAETIKTKSFSRKYFPDGWINVKLVIKRKPNLLCFPKDDGIDSTNKAFYVWPDYKDINNGPPLAPYYPIYGTYKGYKLSNPNKEVIVSLKDTFWTDKYNDPRYVYMLKGIPYDNRGTTDSGQRYAQPFEGFSPKAMFFYFSLGMDFNNGKVITWIPTTKGYAFLDRANTNKIRIEYDYDDSTNYPYNLLTFKDVFVGTRIY